MANETNNLVILKNGLSRTIGATDDVTIAGGLNGTEIGQTTASLGKFSSAEIVGDLVVGGDVISGGTSEMLIADNFIDLNHGLVAATNTAGGLTVNLRAANDANVQNKQIDAFTAQAGGNDAFVTMNAALVRNPAAGSIIATAVATAGDTITLPKGDGSTFSMVAVAGVPAAGQFQIGADAGAQTDNIKAGVDLLTGTPFTTTQVGGAGTLVTVTASANHSETAGHGLNTQSMEITVGVTLTATIAAFTGGTGFSIGDIVQISDISGAGVAQSNAGLFQISQIPSTTKVEFQKTAGASTQAPFVQTNLETSAVADSGRLTGIDLSALAFSEGTLTDSAGAAISKGLLCQAYSLQANIRTWAWESAGNVSLQEAYGVGQSITVNGAASLTFNTANAATGDFVVTAPAGNALVVDGSADKAILGEAGTVKIDFAGYSDNDLIFDTGNGPSTLTTSATQTLDIRAQGVGGGNALTHTLDVDADALTMNAIVDMDIDLTVDTSLGNKELSIKASHDNAGNQADILVESTDGDMALIAFSTLTAKGSLHFHHSGFTSTAGIEAGRIFGMSGSMIGDKADAAGLGGSSLGGVAQTSAAPAAALDAYVVHGAEAIIDCIESHDVGYFNVVDNGAIVAGDGISLDGETLLAGPGNNFAIGGSAAATATNIAAAINGLGALSGFTASAVGDKVLVLDKALGTNGVAITTTRAAAIALSAATLVQVGVDAQTQTGAASIAAGTVLYLSSSSSAMGAFHGDGFATTQSNAFAANDSVMRVGLVIKTAYAPAGSLSTWQPQFIANIA